MPLPRVRHERLARGRQRIDAASFEAAMAKAGVSSTTARFLWNELQPHYYRPLSPHPDDLLESQISVDRPEIDGIVTRFWMAMRGSDAFPRRAPLEPDPSVAELGRHLDRLAGWTVLRAA